MNASEFGIQAQVTCVRRELSYRRFVYPKRIAAGKTTTTEAEREIACMEAILVTLTKLLTEEKTRQELPLFGDLKQP